MLQDDHQNTNSSTVQPISEIHTSSNEQLDKINKELYERNVELAIRNRTLSVLRKMYEIMNSTLGVEETAQKLISAIVAELKFQEGLIALIDKEERQLYAIAASESESVRQIMAQFGKTLKDFRIPLVYQENFCVHSAIHNQRRMTNSLHDILLPLVDEKTAQEIQDKVNIKTSVLFPFVFASEVAGVIILGMDKHVGDLSRAEREILREIVDVVGIAIERAQLYADLKIANERLQEMDRLKDEFVSVTSHELRTPMTAIKSYVWMILNKKAGEIEPKAKDYLHKVYLSTERLINLVNDMLDVSRIESGRIQLQIAPLDLVSLANQVKDEFMARAVERNMGLKVLASELLPPVLADKEKIHQVLENLVGNSFKFTPDGGVVTLTVTMKENNVEVAISDTGRGIAKEDLPKLFTKFGRLGDSLVSMAESGGTGLGLYICKQVIELHQGKIWAESELGKGSTFTFTLPIFDQKEERYE